MRMPTTESICAWDSNAVSAFDAGSDDVLVLERRPLEGLDAAVKAGRAHEYYAPVQRQTAFSEVRAGLRELRVDCRELETDMVQLVNAFLDQFDLKQAKLRLEILRSQPCPNFHCDNVHVRLVTTYSGPTTEYQYAGESTTRFAPLFGLLFLKGHRHRKHGDTVHHRSPEVSAEEQRLCMAIDY